MLPILTKTLRIQGVIVGSVEMLERMIGMIEHLGIRPVIDAAFEMQDIAIALEYLKSGHQVIRLNVVDRHAGPTWSQRRDRNISKPHRLLDQNSRARVLPQQVTHLVVRSLLRAPQ
jgi:hypothetical protein